MCCAFVWHTLTLSEIQSWKRAIIEAIVSIIMWFTAKEFGCQPTSDSRKGENQLDSTRNSSYFSISILALRLRRDLRGLNLQFNIQSRLAIFSKSSTIHITGFLGEVFESAAADKWPEVSRRITWNWWPATAGAGLDGLSRDACRCDVTYCS